MTRPPAAVATFGRLAELDAKMAHGILRYCDHIAAVIDPAHAGGKLRDILPYARRDLPIVRDVSEAEAYRVEEIVIGAAPPGGAASPDIIDLVAAALRKGLWVVHGLHTSFADSAALAGLTARLVELRHVHIQERIAHGNAAGLKNNVLLTVGSDCASGKMTTALDLWRGLQTTTASAAFIATGQTGMYIAGSGAPIDALRSDFVAGAVEHLVLEASDHDFVLVEGQGSILHPAYSGVSLSLLHGSAPNLIVFCHDVGRSRLAYFDRAIYDLRAQIELVETLASTQRPAKVVAVAAMARGLTADDAAQACAALRRELGLPVHLTETESALLVERIQEARSCA